METLELELRITIQIKASLRLLRARDTAQHGPSQTRGSDSGENTSDMEQMAMETFTYKETGPIDYHIYTLLYLVNIVKCFS